MRTQDMPVIDLSGPPREAGRRHGEAMRARIAEILDLWQETAQLPPGMGFADAQELLLTETGCVDQIRRHIPALLEEIAGIAEGANQDPRLVLAFQLGDEARWFFRDRFAAPGERGDRCSAIGARGEGDRPAIVAQNIDVGSWADGMQLLLRTRDPEDGAEALIFTVAGMVAMNGVSGRGFGMCCNTLLQLAPDPGGLPVAAVVRRTLASASLEDAHRFLTAIPHASGQNYLLGGRAGVYNLECCGTGATPYRLGDRADRVVHTNHPLACADIRAALDPLLETSSRRRLDSLMERFAARQGASSVEEAMAVLRARDDADFPVCRETELDERDPYWMTIGATVFEIGETVKLHVAGGPPTQSDFVTLPVAGGG
ncbi:C45 family autoproteolytic acyltransferase/hydrolase [Sphingomonas canadensis]|uniref:C45 family autoproteolytic acyltransferase/hydrolase n=1 Tax=Sphingomonas canadensis TaxID=1219257 RepID=A0ABW3H7B9_9SPHN|nr:C45 family peptidase [Sphingomonas canadensis]MCW3836959.1 C45 family peptidase [Sphingomonas canadensis]